MNTGRALYLDAGTCWQVKLDSGVALHVSAPGRSRSLYPLSRLARVVSPVQAEWTLAALLACLQAGVPVVFHDSHAVPVAWCFGPRRRETTLTMLLREGLTHPEWEQHFRAWQAAAERRQILYALAATGTPYRSLDAAGARVQLCNRHRERLGIPVGRVLRALHCATAAVVGESLQQQVDDATLIGFARPGLHLGIVMNNLLEWATHRVLWASSAADVVPISPLRFAAAAVEQRGATLHRALGELIGSLELHLREWLR